MVDAPGGLGGVPIRPRAYASSAGPLPAKGQRGYEQKFAAFWTNEPAQPTSLVTYTDVNVDGYAVFAIQAGSGYAPTGRLMSAETWASYVQYHFDGGVRHVTFAGYGSSAAVPNIDMSLAYGIAATNVAGVGVVHIACAGYGATTRLSWTWTGGYAANNGWTEEGTGKARACVPTLVIGGIAQTGVPSRSFGVIGAFTVTKVDIWPR